MLHWHRTAKDVCAPFGDDVYESYKKWCDEYFYLPHRGETRGVGGLFFDDLNAFGFERSFDFTRAVAEASRLSAHSRRPQGFGTSASASLYRRGRYVEFNLVYDRGTLFGLQSGGRTESILMSLPPRVRWEYNWRPEPGSPEERLYRDYLRPRDWLNE